MIKEIKFTDKALKQINVLLSKKDKGSFFRIAIKGGGCSGFQYEFTFDKEKAAIVGHDWGNSFLAVCLCSP